MTASAVDPDIHTLAASVSVRVPLILSICVLHWSNPYCSAHGDFAEQTRWMHLDIPVLIELTHCCFDTAVISTQSGQSADPANTLMAAQTSVSQ